MILNKYFLHHSCVGSSVPTLSEYESFPSPFPHLTITPVNQFYDFLSRSPSLASLWRGQTPCPEPEIGKSAQPAKLLHYI